jgi:lipoic acid synthetase
MENKQQELETAENISSVRQGPSMRRPDWLKARIPGEGEFAHIHAIMRSHKLHTVCEEAHCPNRGECWGLGTATFMILGDICTRSCAFCAIKTGRPENDLDWDEPHRVVEAVELMKVRHAVITSVNRDERKDGGAPIFAETIKLIHGRVPECKVEVLIPDFKGNEEVLDSVLEAKPDILNHNIETVPRLYAAVRPQADYRQSLEVLERAKARGFVTKTGMMLGLGEAAEEVLDAMRDVRKTGCDIFTLGQYLRPSKNHFPIARFAHPDEFRMLKEEGLAMGFRHMESGPLVRSSYHAAGQV